MRRRGAVLVVTLAAAGLALAIAYTGSLLVAVLAGVAVLAAAAIAGLLAMRARDGGDRPPDPGRRRFLGTLAAGGLVLVGGGAAAGRALRRAATPNPRPALEAMASDLGSEYLELVRRTYHPGRSGDLQLVLAPFNSSNYPQESRSLVRRDPRTSHASVWLYLERVPIVVWAPGIVPAGADHVDRVSLADLAPTTAAMMGFGGFRAIDGTPLPGIPRPSRPPKVIVTFVIDGGGWNALGHWGDAWPNLKRLAREGTTYRNAITGCFPAVTACAHANIGTGAYPRTHGITGHNVRIDGDKVVKAYGTPGRADPGFLLAPTLADRWSDATGARAWVGQIGYQVWHLGMLGHGGLDRPPGSKPVGVFWDEDGAQEWRPHNPDLFRLPSDVPPPEALARRQAAYVDPGIDAEFDPEGRQAVCCSPPIIGYQGDLIEAAFDSEPIGRGEETSLLYINFKAPDYTGHIYNMLSRREEIAIRAVDEELARVARILETRFRPGEYALIVTADHGQCPLPDTVGGTRVDPIQLKADIEAEFGRGVFPIVQEVVPSEVYLDRRGLADAGVARDDVAAWLAGYRYGSNIGPYVPRSAIERDLLDQRQFAAVFSTDFIASLEGRDLSRYGDTAFADADHDGIPPVSW
jgi:Type I phosphodiesterase / nucleotide pyrophosphatase